MYYNVMRQTLFKSLTSVNEERECRRKSTKKASGLWRDCSIIKQWWTANGSESN
jgi:hypothetical protein